MMLVGMPGLVPVFFCIGLIGCQETAPMDAETGNSTGVVDTSGSDTGSLGSSGVANSDSSGSDSGATSSGQRCEEFVGAVSQSEADSTPRGNWGAERLALSFTDEVVVSDEHYQRALADYSVLDALDRLGCPAGTNHSSQILLSFVSHHDDVLDGTYEPWECANELYGAVLAPIETRPQQGLGAPVVLGLDGVFDVSQVLIDYEGLPGVDSVEVIPVDCHGDLELPMAIPALYGCAEGITWHYWWTDAYPGQPGFPITAGAHLVSEPGGQPAVVCSWEQGREECPPPTCLSA